MAEYNEIERSIMHFYSQGKWREIVELTAIVKNCSTSQFRLFWVLPTLDDLRFIQDIIKEYNLRGITSIGCGCGLLEWLLQQYSGLSVTGIELDKSWWYSKHAPHVFLQDVQYIDNADTQAAKVPRHYALLFCYFNNPAAFVEYIQRYTGDLIFVIGPATGEQRSTNPSPFDSRFRRYGWSLIATQDITHSNDCIAAYSRDIYAK